MKNKNQVYFLVEGAMIAALYLVLSYAQELLLPGTTSMAIQFRLSEILCILCVFTPSAIWGLTIGTLVFNLVNMAALPMDILFGTLATFLAATFAYHLRNVRFFRLPVLSTLMPVLFNGIIIGLELEIFLIDGPFHLGSFLFQGGMVAIGEFGVCVVLGLPFFKMLEHLGFFKKINS
mgnify:CR=1 FL=1